MPLRIHQGELNGPRGVERRKPGIGDLCFDGDGSSLGAQASLLCLQCVTHQSTRSSGALAVFTRVTDAESIVVDEPCCMAFLDGGHGIVVASLCFLFFKIRAVEGLGENAGLE